MEIKNKIAAAACWVLHKRFSALDVVYATISGFCYLTYGVISVESFVCILLILAFHWLFAKLTSAIRLSYLLLKVEKFCKTHSIK